MKTCNITVTGLVQGVGYRPFVAELAEELQIAGQVKNAGGIVQIFAAGEQEALENFIQRLSLSAPMGARVEKVAVEWTADEAADKTADRGTAESLEKGFRIADSSLGEEERRLLPADLPVCPECERELLDPANRRYRYPFISCVSCGPRFSIMKRVPYDRETITMESFPMCDACRAEYEKKGDRRRHAQTIACEDCGPYLKLVTCKNTGTEENTRADAPQILATGEDALQQAIKALKEGSIVAIKDIGGFHFAFLPTISQPSIRLRAFKNRENKPFAVMFPDVDTAREYCEILPEEEKLLLAPERPIVLLEKKKQASSFAPEVCGMSDRMGVLLPCNPLQILILRKTGPLVMTSGNRGGEPIIIRDQDMASLLEQGCPDLMLTHEREIVTPLEDSIYQVVRLSEEGRIIRQILRRGRGIVPEPVIMGRSLLEESFCAGGDLKAVFALGQKDAVYLSSHFGDLEDYRALCARKASIAHMEELLHISPKNAACDLHPAYLSGQEIQGEKIRRIQHHHAHAASVMAEHGLTGPVLGVTFDGTGYGTDGSVWGSEFLLCEKDHFRRLGCFAPVQLPGQDAGAKDAFSVLWEYLLEAEKRGLLKDKDWREKLLKGRNPETVPGTAKGRGQEMQLREEAMKAGIGTVISSSMGRLFDGVSALLGICTYNSYEGECAIALEQVARNCREPYPLESVIEKKDGKYVADSVQLIADIYRGWKSGVPKEQLALGFHQAVAEATARICSRIMKDTGVKEIALSGGTFCNRILMRKTILVLEELGADVYWNEQVPCGDGGLALGQMYLLTFPE